MLEDNEFNTWRCLVALAYADGAFHPAEADFFDKYLGEVFLSSEQVNVLYQDFKDPKDPCVFYEALASEGEKRTLIQRAFELFWSDYDFHEAEQKFFLALRRKL